MYGFVSGVTGIARGPVAGARCSSFSGIAVRAPVKARSLSVVKMEITPDVPPESVLGIGKNIPGNVFLALSVIFLIVGGYDVYQSNILTPLTAGGVKPVYVLGSLLIPISWGCHVAAWIKYKNE